MQKAEITVKVLKSAINGAPDNDARTTECYAFGPFRLNCRTRQLLRDGETIALTPKAFDTLRVLLTRRDRVVDKDELMKLVWPDSFVGDDSLTQNIATLRRALGDPSDQPQYIATIPRRGYRFVAAVREEPVHADDSVVPEPLAATTEAVRATGPMPPRWPRAWMAVSAVATLVVTSLTIGYLRLAQPSTPVVVRFAVSPPDGTTFSPSASFLAVSPNGRFLAFLASRPGDETRLWVRSLDSLTARELIGTDGALGPFWSPDSRYLGFFARGQLKKVSLLGEPPGVLCEAPLLGTASGSWHRNGVILFSQPKGIYRTSATGGAATLVTSVNRQHGESAHVLPQFLPDGRHFLYTARAEAGGSFDSWIVLRSLDSSDQSQLMIAHSQALYAHRDTLLFLRDGALLAQPFDATRLRLTGDPLPIADAEHVGFNPATPRGMFSVSQTGVLAYRTSAPSELGWFDRAGRPLGWIGAPGFDRNPALSADGQRLAVSRYDPTTATRGIWILDVRRGGVASRFTSRTAWETCPVWSPDDTSIIFARGVPNDGALYEQSSNRAMEEHALPHGPRGCPLDWSRDGRYLLYGARPGFGSPGGGLWLVPVSGDGEPQALAGPWPSRPQTPQARISPNGRWLTYVSDASGRSEIYVRSFPDGAAGAWKVSSQGGIEPQWRGDGQELFFLGADKRLMAVAVMTAGAFRTGTPTALFSTDLDPTGLPIAGRNQYLVTADGQRFLINQPRHDVGPSSVTVLVNWPAALKR